MAQNHKNKNTKNKIKGWFITVTIILGLLLMSATGEDWSATVANLIGVGLLALTAILAKRVTKGI